MESKAHNSDFSDLVQKVLNYQYGLNLKQNVRFLKPRYGEGFLVDFADSSKNYFVEVLKGGIVNRGDFDSKIESIQNSILFSSIDKGYLIFIFEEYLSEYDLMRFRDKFKSNSKLNIDFFDKQVIFNFARNFNIKVPEELFELNISSENELDLSLLPEIDSSANANINIWWLNADEQYWQYIPEKIEYYPLTTRNKNGNEVRRRYFRQFKTGDLVVTYQRNPNRHLFGIYKIVPSDVEDSLAFTLFYEFENKIKWDELIEIAEFSESTIKKMSAQGSAFKIENKLFIEIIKRATNIHSFARKLEQETPEFFKRLPEEIYRLLFPGQDIKTVRPKNNPTRSEAISLDHGDKDSLNFRKDVQSLAALIALKEMKPPLAIALFGKWGTGKSFFMNSLEHRIRELSSFQGFIESNTNDFNNSTETKDDLFLRGIAHIKFNAWSYLDANLWAGLVTTIFEKLNQYLTDETKSNVAKLIVQEKLVEQLKALNILSEEANSTKKSLKLLKSAYQAEIENIEIQNQKLFDDELLDFINADPELRKLHDQLRDNKNVPKELLVELKFGALMNEVKNWKSFWKNFKERKSLYKYLLLGIVGVSITVLLNWLSTDLRSFSWTSTLLIFGASFGLDLKKFKKVYLTVSKFRDKFNTLSQQNADFNNAVNDFRAKIQHADEQIELAEKHSKEIDEKIEKIKFDIELNLTDLTISDFVKERSNHDDYKKNIGIVSIVRKDFETLSELFLSKVNEVPVMDESLFKQGKSLQRIVLYIDDLDRCSDEKVLEVLQAVHLLMAFPLFTVVVGVDERSVHNALKFQQLKRYQNIDKIIIESNIKEIEPREYLEKIFQIPFQLPEASETGITRLIDDLIVVSNEKKSNEMSNSIEMGDFEMRDDIEEDHDSIDIEVEGLNDLYEEARFLEPEELFVKTQTSIQPTEIKITAQEKTYLQLFAPIVGNNPRTIKRYINIFRIVKTHENDVFNSDDDTLKIVFLIAFLTGKNRSFAIEFFGSNQKRLNQFLHELSDERGKPLLLQIEELQKQDKRVANILGQTPDKYAELLKFVERFSYKLDTLN